MKSVCLRKCQIRHKSGKILFVNKGDVRDMEQKHPCFRPIEGEEVMPIDFNKAQEQELLESEFNLEDLKDYIRAMFNKNPANRGKEKTIQMLVDCRYRSLGDLNPPKTPALNNMNEPEGAESADINKVL